MASYIRRTLGEVQSNPPLAPLRGGELMRRSRATAVHATGDRVLSHGKRILARVGLNGAKTWHMPDTAVSGWSHPDSTTDRVVIRTPPLAITPGHVPRMSVVCNPSGLTSRPDGVGGYESGGQGGAVKISISFDNGTDTPTITKTLDLPNSKLDNGAQPTGSGAAWGQIYTRRTGPIWPADLTDPATLAAWSDGVTATITVSYIGSPRVIDLVVHEEPHALCYDASTTGWIAPMFAGGGGGQLPSLPGKTPRIKESGSRSGCGSQIVCDAAARMAQELGPVLFFHSAWDEDSQSVASTETDYKTLTSTVSYTELVTGVTTAASTSRPGWSTSSGANALRIQDSEQTVILRDKTNVVPVRCLIYGAMSTAVGSPTATIRFERSTTEYIEVAVAAGTSYAWHSAPGFLRCGLGAQDPHAIQVSGIVTANEFRWRYIMVRYDSTLGA